MSFFESLLVLLAIAIGLMPVSRRLAIPYPTMLAVAGAVLALFPTAPTIRLDPATALALFVAPALCDGASEFPVTAIRRFWRPLFVYAVVAVLFTTALVATLGVYWAGMPLLAAIALGAIVAPPDAVAAIAILGTVRMPRHTVAMLKGESLLNDATALLIFTAALAIQREGAIDASLALHLGLAAPGGLLLGIALACLALFLSRYFAGMLSAYLLEYLMCFFAWIIAEHVGLSAVLCVVAFAMTLARSSGLSTPPQVRLHNLAVSHTSVFVLNVLAFLMMGFQARSIVSGMSVGTLRDALTFAGAVILCIVLARMTCVMAYNRLARTHAALRGNDQAPASWRHGLLVGWSGMRGLVTLAGALALPDGFPHRDLIVLTAFSVVLATLVLQGLTLGPLVRLLRMDGEDGLAEEISRARHTMLLAAGAALDKAPGGNAAGDLRLALALQDASLTDAGAAAQFSEQQRLKLLATREQRRCLEALHRGGDLSPEAYAALQSDLDYTEVALISNCERRIEER